MYETNGSIERFYTGSDSWAWFGSTKGENALDYFDLQIHPAGSGSGKPIIQLNGLKLNTISPSHRPAANLMLETWDFMGTGSVTNST